MHFFITRKLQDRKSFSVFELDDDVIDGRKYFVSIVTRIVFSGTSTLGATGVEANLETRENYDENQLELDQCEVLSRTQSSEGEDWISNRASGRLEFRIDETVVSKHLRVAIR